MNKDLQMQYNILAESIIKLDFVTTQFLIKANDIADQISKQFFKNKNKINKKINFNKETGLDFLLCQDSLMQRFMHSYNLTYNFLKLYVEKTFLIKTDLSEEIFKTCLKHHLITDIEYAQAIKIIK